MDNCMVITLKSVRGGGGGRTKESLCMLTNYHKPSLQSRFARKRKNWQTRAAE